MALPSSRNTSYGPAPRTILSADLNAIQDALIALYTGDHGTRQRFYGPYDWTQEDSAAAGEVFDEANIRWLLNTNDEQYCQISHFTGEVISKVTFFVNPFSSTGLVVGYHEDDIALGTTPTSVTATSSSTGFQQLVVSPAATLANNDMPYISCKWNAGSGGYLHGALVEYTK